VILIIGGGIGGLTAAIALRRAGIDAEVYERAEDLCEVGAGLSLWKNALTSLDTIGLGGAIRQLSTPYLKAGLRTWDGRVLVSPSMEALTKRFGEVAIVVHRATLQKILVDVVGRDRIHLGKACVGIEQDLRSVTATFADGTSVSGDALVGADGLHSVVRKTLHGESAPAYAGYTAWRSVVEFDHQQLATGESWGPGRRFGQIPMAGGQVYWFATHNTPAGGRASGGERAELLRLFAGWHHPIEPLIENAPEANIIRSDIHDRPALASWSVGRVTLLGDAAHPMTPNLGQGGCQAIEDAVVLARSFRDSPDVVSAWRDYETRRIPRTRTIVEASRRFGAMGQWEHPVGIWLRNSLVSRLAPRLQVKQMGEIIGYQATPPPPSASARGRMIP
jgi:2-polyprenyl-6-methoxyphenol hydroxylase-like FAD-dependent oxidoreductase